MKITIEINPKEIADLAVKGQGQPASNNSVGNEVEIFITKEDSQIRKMYYWTDEKSNIFGQNSSIDDIYGTVKKILPNKHIVLKFV